ncbi:MAG: sugar phosphate isomerase/epimerase [Clostridia bacterium]|nr:sugar phosphate isomerase/epimerase [Clostridia bacterium]
MKIVTTTSVFPKCWDVVNSVNRLSAIGFDCFDLGFDYCVQDENFPFMTDGYIEWANTLRETAEKLGKAFSHSHASYDASYKGDMIRRTMECASVMGIKSLIVHPICGGINEKEDFISINKEAYKHHIEVGEEYGIAIFTENLLWGQSISAQVIAELTREIDSPYFGWCYDVGHAHAMGDSLENFRDVCCPPASLHIHDNGGVGSDDHNMPGDGTIDWKDFLCSLKSVGYTGKLVLEAHRQSIAAPDEERDAVLTELFVRSKKMKEYYESL